MEVFNMSKFVRDNQKNLKIDLKKLNFKAYNKHYYEKEFPGYKPEVYKLLEKSSFSQNKMVDMRREHFKSVKIEEDIYE